MKYYFALFLFIPLLSLSQVNLEKKLDSIASSEDAASFLKTYKPDEGKLYTFNKENHKTKLANALFKLSIGRKKVIKTRFKKTYYKIIDKTKVDYCKFNIIVIDAQKKSNVAAKVIRNKVLSQYNEGYKFKDLAKHHSSGPNAKIGGDTGWIKIGEMSETFDELAFNENHNINDVFTIDDPVNKKYYVVMKTEEKKPIEEITVLKFTEDI